MGDGDDILYSHWNTEIRGHRVKAQPLGRAERLCYLSVPSMTRVIPLLKYNAFLQSRPMSSVATANHEPIFSIFTTYFCLPTLTLLPDYKDISCTLSCT